MVSGAARRAESAAALPRGTGRIAAAVLFRRLAENRKPEPPPLSRPPPIQDAEQLPLDPALIAPGKGSSPRRNALPRGLAVSLLLHSLPFLALIGRQTAPVPEETV